LGEFKSRIEKERGEEEAGKTDEIIFSMGGKKNRRNGRGKVGRNWWVLIGRNPKDSQHVTERVWRLGRK
jgi:hypothetical protein